MWSTDPALRLAAPALLLAGLLAGCAPTSAVAPQTALTPTEQYSVQVQESPDELAFSVHSEGLSLTQRAALVAFAGRWRDAPGAGDVVVEAPAAAGQKSGDAAARVSGEVVAGLQAMGVPAHRLRVGDYEAGADSPVKLRFMRLEARGPDCSGGWNNLTSTGSNQPSTHFGCAVTANFAAQVADPRDLLNPANTSAPDPLRRATVLEKYRLGEVFSSAKDEQAAGAVSQTVGAQ